MKKLVLVLIPLLISCSCQTGTKSGCKALDKETCPILKDFNVFGKNDKVHYDHFCSQLEHKKYFRSTYALFEPDKANQSFKAQALVDLNVGWFGLAFKGVGLELVRIKIQSLRDWSNDFFSLALKMTDVRSGKEILGSFSKTFRYSFSPGGGYPVDRKYQMSEEGHFDWEAFKEPEEKKSSAKTEYRNSEDLHLNTKQIGSLKGEYELSLIIKNERTNSRLELRGPYLQNLDSLLDINTPQFQSLGLFQTFNPFQEGSFWDWMGGGLRYKDCIYLRKRAKKEFTDQFLSL